MNTAPVLVGVDGSEGSKRALRWAADYVELTGAPLHALVVWDVPASPGAPAPEDAAGADVAERERRAEAMLADTIAEVVGDAPAVIRRVERGYPAAVLVAASEGAALLVLGSHGLGGWTASLLGSVSQQCTHHAHCPVLLVPGYDT